MRLVRLFIHSPKATCTSMGRAWLCVPLSYGSQSVEPHKQSLSCLSLIRLRLFILLSFIYCFKFFHYLVVDLDCIFFCDDGPFTGNRPCQTLSTLHFPLGVVGHQYTKVCAVPLPRLALGIYRFEAQGQLYTHDSLVISLANMFTDIQ